MIPLSVNTALVCASRTPLNILPYLSRVLESLIEMMHISPPLAREM